MGLLKKIGKFAKDWFSDPLSPFTKPTEMLVDYAKDFKDWFDGTDAQRKANQMNLDNWKLQNEYNTPEAQMARFAAAGLNPNLIYSQSNEAGSIASVQPAMSGGEVLSKAAQALVSFYNIAGLKADIANKKQQNLNLATQDTLLGAQADLVKAQADRFNIDNDWLRRNGTSSLDPSAIRSGKSLFRSLPQAYFNYVDVLDDVISTAYDRAYKFIDPAYYGKSIGRFLERSFKRR